MDDPADILNAILFYAGTYEVNEGSQEITHNVETASNPKRVGQILKRTATVDQDMLTLVGKGDFGTATLTWTRLP